MKYVGIDYHKKYSHVTALSEAGEVICSKRLGEPGRDISRVLSGSGRVQ